LKEVGVKITKMPSFFKKNKKLQNLGIGKDLTKFTKIHDRLVFAIFLFIKSNKILTGFNGKT
jgi:hypothetical protein